MRLNHFKNNIDLALELLSKQKKAEKTPAWLHERTLTGLKEAGLESLPADLGFQLGMAVARFRRIASEVAEADGIAEREQTKEAAAALRAIADILKSLPPA